MKLSIKIFILFTFFSISLFGWTESELIPSEQPNQKGLNDSFTTAADLGNYSLPYSEGTGFIADISDNDYYKIIIPNSENNPDHDILKVSLCAPENTGYRLIIYEDDGAGGYNNKTEISSYNKLTSTTYVDISNRSENDWLYVIQVRADWNSSTANPYYLKIEVVDSGYIQGQINLIGAMGSFSDVNIEARSKNNYINSGITNLSGHYSIKVPVSVEITSLVAIRWWYPSCSPDWAYGRTTKKFTSPIILTNPGQVVSNINFDVYKEGVIAGNISALNNVDIAVIDPYTGDWAGNCTNVNFNYEIHNLEAGNYWMWAKQTGTYNCMQAAQPISWTPNVNVKDGFTTLIDYNIGSGVNVNGSLNPSPVSGVRVYVKPAGLPKSDGTRSFEPFSEYYKVDVSGNTFQIRNLPAGIMLDYRVEAEGPSMWNPVLNTPPISPINFTGPALNSVISGQVIDNTGEYPDKSIIAVYAVISGTTDVMSDILAYVGMCDSSGNFMMQVPSGYWYDLAAVDISKSQNGPPYFVGRTYDVNPGSMSPANIYINSGYYISGNFYFFSNPLSYYRIHNAGCYILKDTGLGSYKFYDMGFGNDNYQTANHIENGNYKIVGFDTFFNKIEKNVMVNGNPLTGQDINFTIDINRDLFKPWAGQLNPANNGYIYADDYLYVTVSDKLLGSGLQFVSIFSDSVPVEDMSGQSLENNTLRYQFRLPTSQRIPGTSHNISISLTDYKGNQYQTTNWTVNIYSSTATPTPTPTGTWWTNTPTSTATSTATPTPTQTYPLNVFGTVSLPATSNGKECAVVIDTDTDGSNGWVAIYFGTTNGPAQFQYSTGAPDGTYYIYGFVDESGDGIMNGPNEGDYFGYYGGGSGPFLPPPFPNANISGPNNVFNFQLYLISAPTPTPTPSGTPIADWYEENLMPSEPPTSRGINDTEGQAATIPNYLNKTGIGYIADQSDNDYYKFTVLNAHNNPNHDMLKITLQVPQGSFYYNLEVYEASMLGGWNFKNSKGANGGKTAVIYVDMSSHTEEDWNYLIRVRSYNNSSSSKPYYLTIEIVDSGLISGNINLIGVNSSGLSNVNIEARTYQNNFINSALTDGMGSYQVRVPVNVPITTLRAVRWWYPSCAPDWAYGKTTKKFDTPIIISFGGEVKLVDNFDVYKEGIISGNITGALLNNVDVIVIDPYVDGDWAGNCNNVNASYAIHNLEPGNYFVYAKQTGTNIWTEANHAIAFKENINVRDGITTQLNFAIESGWTVNGTLNPAPFYSSEVKIQLPGGTKFGENSPLGNYYRTDTSGNNYEIRHVPTGIFDFFAGSGPSYWEPVRNVNVNGNKVVNFTGPNINTTISGQIIDNTGMYPDLSGVIIAAVVSGTANIQSDNAYLYMGQSSASGNFIVGVPSQFMYYDLVALDGNTMEGGAPLFLGRAYDVVTGTASTVININSGYSISGNQYFAGKTLDEIMTRANVWVLKDIGAGVLKFYDFANGETAYITGNFIENGNYLVKSSGYFFNEAELPVLVNGGNRTNQDLNLSINPTKDKYNPYVGYLNPANQGVIVDPANEYLYFTISDKILGSGLQGEPDIFISGNAAVDIAHIDTGLNERRYKFRLPMAARTPGNVAQISIDVRDNQNNLYSTGYSWIVYVATSTITPTPTITGTPTETPTGTWWTDTPKNTYTITNTFTDTPTKTFTYTYTFTPSKTFTLTYTYTYTVTDTLTNTPTETFTPTDTTTNTPTDTATNTQTDTLTHTVTNTATNTPTDTSTTTPTETVTGSQPPTWTHTDTATNTITLTPSNTTTFTNTFTFTHTHTVTNTHTISNTPTITETPTITPTQLPVDKLMLNKNLINISKNEIVKIRIPERYKGKEGKIMIYTRNGKLVKMIEKVSIDDDIAWDGKNDAGKKVAAGVYIIRIKIESTMEILKVAIIK